MKPRFPRSNPIDDRRDSSSASQGNPTRTGTFNSIVATANKQVVGFASGAPANERLQCPAGIKLFAVAPEWRGEQVATGLFDELETRLRTTRVTRAVALAAGNNRLTQGLDVRYTPALCFLEARG